MDYRTWDNLQPGDIVKGPLGRLYEVIRCLGYTTRGRPHWYEVLSLYGTKEQGEAIYSILHRFEVDTYTLIEDDRTIKVLFSKG